MNICRTEWEVRSHLNVLQRSLPEFDIGPITASDNAAVCCFRLYWTEDVPLSPDPPHETKAVWAALGVGFRLITALKAENRHLTPEMS